MTEQPLPTPGGQAVTPVARDLFNAMLAEREQKGIATYGMSLTTNNGRDAVQDVLEELIDAWQYVVQIRMERDTLTAQLAASEQRAAAAEERRDFFERNAYKATAMLVEEYSARKAAEAALAAAAPSAASTQERDDE